MSDKEPVILHRLECTVDELDEATAGLEKMGDTLRSLASKGLIAFASKVLKDYAALTAEATRMEMALQFYADEALYLNDTDGISPAKVDSGALAREVLHGGTIEVGCVANDAGDIFVATVGPAKAVGRIEIGADYADAAIRCGWQVVSVRKGTVVLMRDDAARQRHIDANAA